MQRTEIAWTDFSSNPLQYHTPDGRVVWGCIHKSAGCEHCYAEQLAKRFGRGEGSSGLLLDRLVEVRKT